jgi:hypothetical protein
MKLTQDVKNMALNWLGPHPLAIVVGGLWGEQPLTPWQREKVDSEMAKHPGWSERQTRDFIGEQLLAEARRQGII